MAAHTGDVVYKGYSAHAVNSFEIALNQSYTFRQLPTLFPERVREVNELTRADRTRPSRES